jgi:hypothetical protein
MVASQIPMQKAREHPINRKRPVSAAAVWRDHGRMSAGRDGTSAA